MSTYCDVAPGHPFHGPYHEREYGFPSRDDAVLFGNRRKRKSESYKLFFRDIWLGTALARGTVLGSSRE